MNGSVETGVGNAANIHLAASTGARDIMAVWCRSRTPKEKAGRNWHRGHLLPGRHHHGRALAFASGDIIAFRQSRGSASRLDEGPKLKHYRLDLG